MGFCVDVLLRLAAQQQQSIKPVLSQAEGVEDGLDVIASCANVTHRTNYTKKNTDCNIINRRSVRHGSGQVSRINADFFATEGTENTEGFWPALCSWQICL